MGTLHLLFPSSCPNFPALPWTPAGWTWWNASPKLFFPLASVGKWRYYQAPEGQGREVTCLFPGSFPARQHFDKCLHFSTQGYSSFQIAPLWELQILPHSHCHPTSYPSQKAMASYWFGSFSASPYLVGAFHHTYTFTNTHLLIKLS